MHSILWWENSIRFPRPLYFSVEVPRVRCNLGLICAIEGRYAAVVAPSVIAAQKHADAATTKPCQIAVVNLRSLM